MALVLPFQFGPGRIGSLALLVQLASDRKLLGNSRGVFLWLLKERRISRRFLMRLPLTVRWTDEIGRRRSRNGVARSELARPLFPFAQRIEERFAGRDCDDPAARTDPGGAGSRPLPGPRAAQQPGEFRRNGRGGRDRTIRIHAERRKRRITSSYPDPAEMGEKRPGGSGPSAGAARLFYCRALHRPFPDEACTFRQPARHFTVQSNSRLGVVCFGPTRPTW